VDFEPGDIGLRAYAYFHVDERPNQPEFKLLNTPSLEAAALDSLTLEEYHMLLGVLTTPIHLGLQPNYV
jgi:hypothetical protein